MKVAEWRYLLILFALCGALAVMYIWAVATRPPVVLELGYQIWMQKERKYKRKKAN